MNDENEYVAMFDIFFENWHAPIYSSEAMVEDSVFSIPDYHFPFLDPEISLSTALLSVASCNLWYYLVPKTLWVHPLAICLCFFALQ